MALTGSNNVFKYDIAFSFVKEDEGLATQINDLVQDRYRTFLYSKAQEQLAGTDGEKTFNAVFGKEARIVAVLLRPEWGNTPWTRIEETAIRNRAHDEGYDFTTFIVTEPKTPIPKWLPKTRIWYNLERFGPNGAAAALEARVQDRGGAAVEETLVDRAVRLRRAQDLNEAREAFQRSREGVDAAREAYRRLVGDLKTNTELLGKIGCRVQDVYGGITMLVGKGIVMTGKDVVLTGKGVVLTVRAHFPYENSLENTVLVAQFYDGVPRLPGLLVFDDPRTLKTWRFTFGLLGPGRTGWVGPDGKEHASEALAEFLLRHFMELQQQQVGQAK